MSGVEVGQSWVRKGAVDAILGYLNTSATAVGPTGSVQVLRPNINAETTREIQAIADAIAKSGGTPLAVAKDGKLLGVVHLKASRAASASGSPNCAAWASARS
jgi:K+-transporting ATPase ATPase B chain